MGTSTAVGVVTVLALGAGIVVVWGESRRLERQLQDLEAANQAAVEAARAPLAAGPTLVTPPGPTPEVRALERTVADLATRVAAQEERAKKAPLPGAAPAGAFGTAAFEEAVRGVVERLLEDEGMKPKVAKAARGTEVPKKPHIDLLTKALTLDAGQDRRFRDDLQEMQSELFALLAEERPDGVVPMAEIQKAEGLAEHDPARAEIFVKLMKLRIVGSEQTYFEKAVELTTAFRRKTAEYLRADQTDLFNRLDVDLFGVQWQ